MCHPDYVYRPWGNQRRAEASARSKKRLGIPADCRRIYGVHVPIEQADRILKFALIVARLKGNEQAHEFVKEAKDENWNVEMPMLSAWGQRDWQLYRDLIAEGMSREEVAEFAGVVEWYLNKGVDQHRKGRKV